MSGIPSESEVKENGGIGLGEMQVKLLQKIEELTLDVIGQEKRIQELESELKERRKENKINKEIYYHKIFILILLARIVRI